jgi:putative FmdB family regulatory protein
MPIYEYKCESCAIVFERVQHFEDEPLKTCPECGGEVRRVLQPVGVIFKGSGFYITDHRQVSSGASRPPKQLAEPKDSDEKKALPAPESSKAKSDKAEKTEATD